jgi:hypothetical protein
MSDFSKVCSAIVGGAATASLVASGCVIVIVASTSIVSTGVTDLGAFLSGYFFLFMYSFVLCLATASTLGLGWHVFASSRGLRSAAAYYFPAGMVGFLGGTLLIQPLVAQSGMSNANWGAWALTSTYGALLGGLTGLYAWQIRRPDRDQSSPSSNSTSA